MLKALFFTFIWSVEIASLCIQGLMALRTAAIYTNTRAAMWFIWISTGLLWTSAIILFSFFTSLSRFEQPTISNSSCLLQLAASPETQLITINATVTIYECSLSALMLYKTYQAVVQGKYGLAKILFLHGLLYSCFVTTFGNIAVLVLSIHKPAKHPFLVVIVSPFLVSISTVLVCRSILDLRSYVQKSGSTRSLSTVRFERDATRNSQLAESWAWNSRSRIRIFPMQ